MHHTSELLILLSVAFCVACLVACVTVAPPASQISHAPFGTTPDGSKVALYTLRNRKGAEVRICNYGGIVVSLKVPDRNGQMADVVLGFDNFDEYVQQNPFFGCLVGRYGNRIAKGKFILNGKEYTLAINNPPNALHGGMKGFDKVIWEPRILATPEGPALELRYLSKDGEEGYPGNLSVTAVYTWTDDNALKLEYTATTDKDTVLTLTQHSYFNLSGKGNILDHEVVLLADEFTPVDSTLIPTGELRPVAGTPFDFRTPTAIGARINQDDEQLKFCHGYDLNFVANKPPGKLDAVARVADPKSGRVLEVLSSEPGVQFYTGNFLNGVKGKGGWEYQIHSGFCLEPQHFPDSPNQPAFPSATLKPNEVYQNTIIYRFSVQGAK